MEHHAGLGGVLEARLPLDDDERARPVRGEGRGGPRQGPCHTLGEARGARWCECPAERADPADALQAPPQLGLEDDHERQQSHHGTRLEDPGQQPQVQQLGHGVHAIQHDGTDDQPDRPGPLDEAEQAVEEQRGEGDVEHRRGIDGDPADQVAQLAHVRGTLSACPVVCRSGSTPPTHQTTPPAAMAASRGSEAWCVRASWSTPSRVIGSSSSVSSRERSSNRSTPRSFQPRWK